MYEEVCLLCGRPVLADGRPYCSDECEGLDVTSPSISTTSSAHPSPFLQSAANAAANLPEVPALLPSALGHSLKVGRKTHRVHHSVSSSSNSSVSWSALEDDYEEESTNPALYSAGTDDEFAIQPDLSQEAGSSKPSSSFGIVYRQPASSLAYVRRPSTTNNKSTIPMLHHRTSSTSTTSSHSVSHSMPYSSMDDESSDVPSACASSASGRSGRRSGRKSTDSAHQVTDESEREKDDTVTSKNRRNRASLPAYFSLLTSTSPAVSRSQKSLSALQTLSMISRSLQSSSSPPTPRLAKPIVDTATAFATPQASRVPKALVATTDVASRGRSRQRDIDGRSSSIRRSSSRSPRVHAHAHHGAHVRARLDSMEKVADWVAHSPVVAASVRMARHQVQHRPHERRNSSPPPLPRFEKVHLRDSGVDVDIGYINGAVEECFDEEDESEEPMDERDTRRGRRRPDELDSRPGLDPVAPGYGNGRSGLMARERTRGRTASLKR
ncbi:hypothetical protein BN946_scf184781.g21 [Trametes cinnabarina]|uniref:Uncharacterized protein n=1 Tax=Pycnoporus cinnabarinus TaxID=5643 RepID=A0A060SW53_PYCCI|nr:hypothetical protein BN946_scf184781.g21 [Trametes cinnabarina]